MEERLLKFACLVEATSFTAAASTLRISQPALSVAIARLERDLGVQLIVRPSRPLRFTKAGQQAYQAAKEVAVSMANLKTQLADLHQDKQALAIGLTDSVAAALFQSDVALHQLDSQAHMSFVVDNSRQLYRAVAHAGVDAAFAVARDDRPAALAVQPVGIEPLVLVSHTARAVQDQQSIGRSRLPAFISFDRVSTTCQIIEAGLSDAHLEAERRFYSTSPEVILRLVLLQKGAAFLPWRQVDSLVSNGSLILLRLPSGGLATIDRPIVYVTRLRRRLPASLMPVIERVSVLLTDQQQSVSRLALVVADTMGQLKKGEV